MKDDIVVAKWEEYGYPQSGQSKCTKCLKVFDDYEIYDYVKRKFVGRCPHCGAMMKDGVKINEL